MIELLRRVGACLADPPAIQRHGRSGRRPAPYANGVEANHYGAFLGSVPTWFTPTGLICSDTASKIVPADCTLVNFGSGFGSLILASSTGDILTFTVTGTAAPTSTDVGTPGTAMANACIDYPAIVFCSDAFASVDVIAAAATPAPPTPAPPTVAPTVAPTPTPSPTRAATPPPTSTGVTPASGATGSITWSLPVALIAFFGGLLALAIRQRRRIS